MLNSKRKNIEDKENIPPKNYLIKSKKLKIKPKET